MSENTSPINTVFEFQRSTIEQTHETLRRGVEFQQDLSETVVGSFDPVRGAQQRSQDLVRTGFDTYFDAVESAVPGDQEIVTEFRETIEERLDTLEGSQLDAVDAFEQNLEEGTDAVDELLEDFLESLDEQIASLLESHEEIEDQTVDALETLEEQIADPQDELEERREAVSGQLEEQIDDLSGQLEEGTDTLQGRIEDVTEQVEDVADQADLSA